MLPKAVIIGGGIIGVIILLGVLQNNQGAQKSSLWNWFPSPSPSPMTMLRDWFQDENGSSVEIIEGRHAVAMRPDISSALPATVTVVRENGAVSIATISGDPKKVCRDANTCSADLVPFGTSLVVGPVNLTAQAPTTIDDSDPSDSTFVLEGDITDHRITSKPTPFPTTTTRPTSTPFPTTTTRPTAIPTATSKPKSPNGSGVIKVTVTDKDGNIITNWPKPTPTPPWPDKYRSDGTWWDWFLDWNVYDAPEWFP